MGSSKAIKKEASPAAPGPLKPSAASTSDGVSRIAPKSPSPDSTTRRSAMSTRQTVTTISRGLLTVIDRDNDYAGDDGDLMDLSDDSVDSDEDDDPNDGTKGKIGAMQAGDLPFEEESRSQTDNTASRSNEQAGASQGHCQSAASQSQTPSTTKGLMGPDTNQASSRFVPEQPTASATPGSQRAASVQPRGSVASKPTTSPTKPASTQPPTAQSECTAPPTQTAATSSTATKEPTKPDPLAPTPAAPYGYKIVKVKKPDGSIVKVRRPIKAEEASKATTTTDPAVASQTSSHLAQTIVPSINPSSDATHTSHGHTEESEKRVDIKSEIRVTEKELQADETGEPQSPVIAQPKSITRQISRIMQILSWVIMIALPLLFIALGIWAAIANNKRVPDKYSGVSDVDPLTQAIKIAASLWPIIFAAIVAQTLKSYAAWKVERGIPLITLEQLISSHSVGGAVKQPFMLRTLNWTSIILIVLWALSPIAGQAILRMSYTKYFSPQTELSLQWIDPYTQIYNDWDICTDGGDISALSRNKVDVMYSDLIIGTFAGQMGPQDPWNNVKIPIYNSSHSAVNSSSWSAVDWSNGWTSQSALVGYPIYNRDATSKLVSYNFTLNTSYFALTCGNQEEFPVSDVKMQALNFEVSPSKTFYAAVEKNFKINPSSPDETSAPVPGPSGVLHFGSKAETPQGPDGSVSNDTYIWYTRCEYRTVLLQNLVGCIRNDLQDQCQVLFQKLDTATTATTPLGLNIAKALVNMGNTTENVNCDSESYVRYPEFAATPSQGSSVPWTNVTTSQLDANSHPIDIKVDGPLLSKNLGVLVNTLNMLGTWHYSFLASNLSEIERASQIKTLNATGWTVAQPYLEWQLSIPWLVVLMVCSVILLVAGTASAILENRTIGPDFLGFANTAIKRSVKLPKEMNHLSARDRLSALTECEVLLQDVKPNAGMGKIALGVKEDHSTYLVRGRDYR